MTPRGKRAPEARAGGESEPIGPRCRSGSFGRFFHQEKPLLPSGYVKIAIENDHRPIEIVDFPIKNGDFQ